MKSLDPLDPKRLTVDDAQVVANVWNDEGPVIRLHVTFTYQPWWGEAGQDVLWEQANALTCLREALKRGGVGAEE
jgi:hypothetical protein